MKLVKRKRKRGVQGGDAIRKAAIRSRVDIGDSVSCRGTADEGVAAVPAEKRVGKKKSETMTLADFKRRFPESLIDRVLKPGANKASLVIDLFWNYKT